MQSAQPGERGELGLPRGRLARGAGSKDLTSLPSTLVVRAGSCSDLSWLGDAGGPGQTGSGRNLLSSLNSVILPAKGSKRWARELTAPQKLPGSCLPFPGPPCLGTSLSLPAKVLSSVRRG